MTEITDGARILQSHIDELHEVGAIDDDRKGELEDQLNALVDELMHEYDSM